MSLQSVIWLVVGGNLILLVMAHRAWQWGREDYDKLAEQIPVHFGFSGQPDRWARKSAFTVYWIPVTMVLVQVIMTGCYSLVFLDEDAGSPSVLMLLGMLLTFAINWMLYKVQRGTLDHAMGGTESIWTYIKLPFAATIIVTVIMCVYPFIEMKKTPEIEKIAFCSNVTEKGNPKGVTDEFAIDEDTVFIHVEWKNLNGKVKLRYDWIAPDGTVVHEGVFEKKFKRMKSYRSTWYRLDLNYFRDRDVQVNGEWKVKISLDGDPVGEDTFVIQ